MVVDRGASRPGPSTAPLVPHRRGAGRRRGGGDRRGVAPVVVVGGAHAPSWPRPRSLVLGVLVAVPSRWSDPSQLPAALGDVLLGTVTGWKDLITVDLPVGSYRNLLVPALVVFLLGTLLGLRVAWKNGRAAAPAAVVCLAMVFFGLAFGRPVTSDPLLVGPWTVPAPLETFVGASALLCTLGWMAWRSQDARRQALHSAADATGVRVSRRRIVLRHAASGCSPPAMLVVAVAAAAVAGPLAARGPDARGAPLRHGPELVLTRATSPLSEFRSHFSDEAFDEVLFRVEPVGPAPERIRIATLTSYDGELFRALDVASSTADARFTRVPSRLSAAPGDPIGARITIEGLRGIWMPTAGALTQVDFDGADAAALADGFYYNRSTAGAVEVAGGGPQRGRRLHDRGGGRRPARTRRDHRPRCPGRRHRAAREPGHLARGSERRRRRRGAGEGRLAPPRARIPQPCPRASGRRAPRVGERARRLLLPAECRGSLAGADRRALPSAAGPAGRRGGRRPRRVAGRRGRG